MSTIKVDTIATRTGSGNITVSNATNLVQILFLLQILLQRLLQMQVLLKMVLTFVNRTLLQELDQQFYCKFNKLSGDLIMSIFKRSTIS